MLLFADGFDHYGADAARMLDGVYSEITGVSLVGGARTGARCVKVQVGYNDSGMRRVLPGDRTVVGMGYAFNLNFLPNGPRGLALAQFLTKTGARIGTITVLPTGAMEWREGGRDSTVVATSAPVLRAGSWQHFECEMRADVGAIEVRIDGVTRLSVVASAATGDIGQVYIAGCYGYPKTGATGVDILVDDLFCRDDLGGEVDSWIGDKKAYTRLPATDGPEQDWTISVGDQSWAMLDNVPPQDGTEYLTADTAGKTVSVGIAPFPTDIVSISGVYVATRLWKNDAGNAKVSIQVESGSSATANPTHPISTAPVWYGDVAAVNPATGAPWLISEINALRVAITRDE